MCVCVCVCVCVYVCVLVFVCVWGGVCFPLSPFLWYCALSCRNYGRIQRIKNAFTSSSYSGCSGSSSGSSSSWFLDLNVPSTVWGHIRTTESSDQVTVLPVSLKAPPRISATRGTLTTRTNVDSAIQM